MNFAGVALSEIIFESGWPLSRILYVVIDSPQAHKQWGKIPKSGRIVSTVLLGLLSVVLAWSPAVAFDLGKWVPGLTLSPFFSERLEYQSNAFRALPATRAAASGSQSPICH